MSADGFVFNGGVVIDDDLVAVEDGFAVDAADVHDGFASALTDGFELFEGVGKFQEALAAGEAFAAEVGAQAIADAGDPLVHDNGEELIDLGGGQELRLINQDTIDSLLGEDVADENATVGVGRDRVVNGASHAQARDDFVAAFSVNAGL